MKYLNLLVVFSIITAVTCCAAGNGGQNDFRTRVFTNAVKTVQLVQQKKLRTRYNLTTQEPYYCQLAAVSHLPVDERNMIGNELIKLHREQGLSCVGNPNALNKDGKSAYDIAKEKYNETRSNYCLMFIDTLTNIEKSIEEGKKLAEETTKKHKQEWIAVGGLYFCAMVVLVVIQVIRS